MNFNDDYEMVVEPLEVPISWSGTDTLLQFYPRNGAPLLNANGIAWVKRDELETRAPQILEEAINAQMMPLAFGAKALIYDNSVWVNPSGWSHWDNLEHPNVLWVMETADRRYVTFSSSQMIFWDIDNKIAVYEFETPLEKHGFSTHSTYECVYVHADGMLTAYQTPVWTHPTTFEKKWAVVRDARISRVTGYSSIIEIRDDAGCLDYIHKDGRLIAHAEINFRNGKLVAISTASQEIEMHGNTASFMSSEERFGFDVVFEDTPQMTVDNGYVCLVGGKTVIRFY